MRKRTAHPARWGGGDNTFRQISVAFGTREQAAERARWRAERLAAR